MSTVVLFFVPELQGLGSSDFTLWKEKYLGFMTHENNTYSEVDFY